MSIRPNKVKTTRMPIRLIKPIYRSPFGAIDRKRVADYRRMLREGSKPPPIDLGARLPDGRWQLLEARHRLKAAELEGRKIIEAFRRIE